MITKKNLKNPIFCIVAMNENRIIGDGKNLLCEWHECGDEAYMLGKKLTNIPIVVDEKRYRGGHFIIKQFKFFNNNGPRIY